MAMVQASRKDARMRAKLRKVERGLSSPLGMGYMAVTSDAAAQLTVT